MSPWRLIATALIFVLPGGSLILLAVAAAKAIRTLRGRREEEELQPLSAPVGRPMTLAAEKTA